MKSVHGTRMVAVIVAVLFAAGVAGCYATMPPKKTTPSGSSGSSGGGSGSGGNPTESDTVYVPPPKS